MLSLYSKTAASTTKFSVTANTTSLRGGANAVTRRVRKFVVHGSYNSKTNVITCLLKRIKATFIKRRWV
jgi:hypothetical protein